MGIIREGTLAFRNPDQKVIWDCELTGQLSDGQWENTMPYDHWEAWCRADSIVDPDDVGRDFSVKKDGYGFTRTDFLSDGIAERIMGYVRVARTFGYDKDVRAIADYDKPAEWMSPETRAQVESIDQSRKVAVVEDESIYDRKALMADLRDMQRIIKRVRGTDDSAPPVFVIKSGNRRDSLHVSTCGATLRGQTYWNRTVDFSRAVDEYRRPYGVDIHDCIKDDLRKRIIQASAEARDKEARAKARQSLLIDTAVAHVAHARLAWALGTLTADEQKLLDEYIKQVTNGDFTPYGVRDLREVAIKRRNVA